MWKGRFAVATRLAYLIDIARERGTTRPMPRIDTLARQLQVHPRTVRRDLNAMEAANILFRRNTGDE